MTESSVAPVKCCSKCGIVKPVGVEGEFHRCGKKIGGYRPVCASCCAELARARRAALKPAEQTLQRVGSGRVVSRNTEPIEAAELLPERIDQFRAALTAIRQGQQCLNCREHGFSLVIDRTGAYHARRLDQPIRRGEKAIAHFVQFDLSFLRRDSPPVAKWIIHAPPIVSADQRMLAALTTLAALTARLGLPPLSST